jgi:WD domain, G-beta repeat
MSFGGERYEHQGRVVTAAISPDGQRLASFAWTEDGYLFNIATCEVENVYEKARLGKVACAAFTPDGKWLAATSLEHQKVFFWPVENPSNWSSGISYKSGVNTIAFSPDRYWLASALNDGTVHIWDMQRGKLGLEQGIHGHAGMALGVAFSPDGSLLASCGRDTTVRLWNVVSGHLLRTLTGHTDVVSSVAFSPDGRQLASASEDKTVRLWSVETGAYLGGSGTESRGPVQAVVWSPDGSIFITQSCDLKSVVVRLYHAASYRLIASIAEPLAKDSYAGFSDEGFNEMHLLWMNRALAISADGRVLVTYANNLNELIVRDISALDVGPKTNMEPQPRSAIHVRTDAPLRAHLLTLPLSHAEPPTPARPAAWLRSAAAAGVRPPLSLVQDLGALLTQPRSRLRLARPAHLPPGVDTSAYLNLLTRLAERPLLRELSAWDISESVAGVVIARLVEGLSFPEIYNVPGGVEAMAFAQRLGAELSKADAGRIWREAETAERPSLSQLLPTDALARIEANLRRLDADELRFLHQYGPRFAGAPDPREMLDLFNLLDLPPAVRLALNQVLRLLPRVSQAMNKGGGMQTYAMGGYAGLTHKGSLDSLVPTELAYPSQMFLHRLLNQEALYYGRESEQERQREITYVVTQAGLDVRGDVDVLMRALTLALAQAMQGRGHEVRQGFVGSRWTEPAEMTKAADVQRVLYYKDAGALRSREMLAAVLGQLRAWRERYRGLHVIWVVGEHWDADECEENRDLYAALKNWGNQQAWFVRLGRKGARVHAEAPIAARDFGRYQIVNSDVMWAKREPPVKLYVPPPVEAEPETATEAEDWIEPFAPPSRVMLVPRLYSGRGGEAQDFIRKELQARGHLVMADGALTNDASWIAALRNVDLVIATITEETAHSAVASSAIQAARSFTQQGEGPRLLPVRVAYEGPLSPSIDNAQSSSQYFIWRDARDNNALLRAMLETLAPAPSLLRLDGLYHHPLNVPVVTRQWLRFYPDGRVAYKTLPEAAPEQAARWLSEELRDGTATVGSYKASGNHFSLRFETERARNNVWRYRGFIRNNGLTLDDFERSNARRELGHEFQFAAIAPPLRFDGMYVSSPWLADDIHPEKDWGWEVSALRFSSDGTLFYCNAWGYSLTQKKTPGERDLRGTYQLDDMNITISFPNSSGPPEVREARIDGETIVLSGSRTGGYHFRKDEDA